MLREKGKGGTFTFDFRYQSPLGEIGLTLAIGTAFFMAAELATNAAKYGALSDKNGRVSIRWERRPSVRPPDLMFEWQEIGGPPVVVVYRGGR